MNSIPIDTKKIRPSRSPYIVFSIIWGGVSFLGLYVSILSGNWQFPVLWIGIFLWIFSACIIYSHSIEYDERNVSYVKLFAKKSFFVNDVVRINAGIPPIGFNPAISINIFIKEKKKPIIINIKLFSRKDINEFIDFLEKEIPKQKT